MAVQSKRRVGILGATGTVGQRLIHMLRNHPYFEVTALAASDRSEGKRFADVCNWKLPVEMPEAVKGIKVFGCKPPLDCDVVISSLPSDIAVEAEAAFAAAGFLSSAIRRRTGCLKTCRWSSRKSTPIIWT